MAWTSRGRLLSSTDAARVRSAIERAEQDTSGRICVSIAAFFWGDPHKAARRAFRHLELHRSNHHNGVLLFVIPSRRRFVVLGDVGVHARVGAAFWNSLSAALSERFRDGDFTGGLVRAVEAVGDELRRHFPSGGAGEAP